jgi:hypothetical protein
MRSHLLASTRESGVKVLQPLCRSGVLGVEL